MATTDTYRVIVDTSQAQSSLNRLNAGLEKTGSMFGRLRNTLVGVGFAAFAKSAINAAGELKDLSDSSGVAVDALYKLSAALQTAGGDASKLPQMFTTFAKSIDEAAGGSLKAQNTFRELGVSIDDLGSKGTTEILAKAVKSLADMEDPVRRTALQLDLLGKGAATLSPKDLREWSDEMLTGSERTSKTADSIRKAGELNDKFSKALFNLKVAFVEAFEPAIDLINKWSEKTEEGTSQLDKMVTVLKLVGVAMAAVFASSLGYGLVKVTSMLGRGFLALKGLIGGTAVATTAVGTAARGAVAGGIFRAAGPHMNALRAIVVVVTTIGASIAAASALFEDFGDVVGNVMAKVLEDIAAVAGAIAGGIFGAAAGTAAGGPIGGFLGALAGAGAGAAGMEAIAKKAREAREAHEAQVKAAKEAAKATKDAQAAATPDGNNNTRTVDTSEYQKAISKARELGDEYRKNNELIKNRIQTDIVLIGKSQEEIELIQAKKDLYQRERDEIDKLVEAKRNLTAEEKKAGVGAEYDKQIEAVKARTASEEETLEMLIRQKQEKQRIFDIDQFSLSQQIDTADKLRGIQSEMAQLTMGTLAKKYKEIEDAAENTYQSKLAEAKLNNKSLSESDITKIRDAAYAGVQAQKEAAKTYYDTSRTFSTGWQQAFTEYAENATNAANHARTMFQTATEGMTDAIINFAKTGKFEIKNLLQMLAEAYLRIQTTRLLASAMGGSTGNLFAGFFANGGTIPAGQYGIVGERGPEIVKGPAQVTSTNDTKALMGGSTNITYNINAVDAASFKDLLARDPGYVHAVVAQGAKTSSATRR